MIYPLFESLDKAIQHRPGAAAFHPMPNAVNIQPFSGGLFATADLITHRLVEDFRSTAGERTKPCLPQSFERILNRHAEDTVGQMAYFNGRKRLNVQIR